MQPVTPQKLPLSLPVPQWPPTDRERWLASTQPADLLTEESIAFGWSAAHRENVEAAYGDWLAWLDCHGLLDAQAAPHERLTPTRLQLYRTELVGRLAASSVAIMVQRLGAMMQVIEPDRDWAWLKKAIANLRQWAAAIGPKPKKIVSIEQLLQLGFDLMEKHSPASQQPVDAATLYRDGLMIALLAQRPVRRSNLCQIRWGQHLVELGGKLWLRYTADETKTGQPLEYRWPDNLEFHLHQYRQVHRPVLLAQIRKGSQSPGSALWISGIGTMLQPNSAHARFTAHTYERFGFSVSPHLFRTCVATGIAVNDPEHVYIAGQVLGHANLSTTYVFYVQAESFKATQEFGATINKLGRLSPTKQQTK